MYIYVQGVQESTCTCAMHACVCLCTCTLRVGCLHNSRRLWLNTNLLQLVAQEPQFPLHLITTTNIISELALECTHIRIQLQCRYCRAQGYSTKVLVLGLVQIAHELQLHTHTHTHTMHLKVQKAHLSQPINQSQTQRKIFRCTLFISMLCE